MPSLEERYARGQGMSTGACESASQYIAELEEVRREWEMKRYLRMLKEVDRQLRERENLGRTLPYRDPLKHLLFEKDVERDPIYRDDIPHR